MAKGLLVEFYMDAVHLKAKSDKEGRPIFEDREFVRIIPIGDTKTVQSHEATDRDRERFAEEYAAFKRGAEQAFSGTPLKEWPIMLPAQIKLFNHFNVWTVEQVAELDDISINRIGPGTRDLVNKAKAYILQAKRTADAQAFAAENAHLKDEIQTLKEQMAQLVQSGDEPRRGPGRPRKEPVEEAA